MKKIPIIDFKKPSSYTTISRKEFDQIKREAIKEWHFEKSGSGVKPIAGKFDPTNPKHLPINRVLREYVGGKWTAFKE